MKRATLASIAMFVWLIGIPALAAAAKPVDRSLPQYTGIPYPALRHWSGLSATEGGMTLWDDFNRPDGPLGPNWTDQSPGFAIVSNAAVGGNLALSTHNTATGDAIEIDIVHGVTSGTQYDAAVLNYGGGSTALFMKVQDNGSGSNQFDTAACYIGNNGSNGSFGLGFFLLTAPFNTAHMRVEVDAARTVTITFSNIDGGGGTQTYTCLNAPPPEGPAVGMGGFGTLASIDNFSSGPVPVELMNLTIE